MYKKVIFVLFQTLFVFTMVFAQPDIPEGGGPEHAPVGEQSKYSGESLKIGMLCGMVAMLSLVPVPFLGKNLYDIKNEKVLGCPVSNDFGVLQYREREPGWLRDCDSWANSSENTEADQCWNLVNKTLLQDSCKVAFTKSCCFHNSSVMPKLVARSDAEDVIFRINAEIVAIAVLSLVSAAIVMAVFADILPCGS